MEEVNVILYGKLVNLGKWAAYHPGGVEILKAFHERDATEQFEAMHSDEAKQQLAKNFLSRATPLADIKQNNNNNEKTSSTRTATTFSASSLWAAPSTAIMENDAPMLKSLIDNNEVSKDFIELKKTLHEKGLFKTNIVKEFLMAFYTLSMYALGGYFIYFTQHPYLGLFFLYFGLHQSGWVAHDYLHHAIFPSVYWNEFVGNGFAVLQGYDGGWWKSRHNLHHVNTNECLHDPDISIAPLFHFVQQYPDLKKRLNWIQKYQHLYFIPFLFFLDIDWRFESFLFAKAEFKKDIFAVMVVSIVGIFPSLLLSLARGFSTAIIVFSNHYGEKRYISAPYISFAEQTANTTRNIGGGLLIDLFSGHISLQIEHHLFPTMPPHNLATAKPLVQQFFKKHNLPYYESSLLECTKLLLRSLDVNA